MIANTDTHRIDLGTVALKQELKAAGWTARTPDDDRKPRNPDDESPNMDYSDPTGEMGIQLDRMHDDLNQLQDNQRQIEHLLRQSAAITKRYVPTTTGDPKCSRNDCDETVERNGRGNGFVGCILVAGIWCAKPDALAVCGGHRKYLERLAKAEAKARAEWLEHLEQLAS